MAGRQHPRQPESTGGCRQSLGQREPWKGVPVLSDFSSLTPAQQRAAVARAHLANTRHKSPEAGAEAERLRAQYAAERLADHIRRVVDQAPPLTPQDRDRLCVLLRGDDQ